MRRLLLVANWKLNKTIAEAQAFAAQLAAATTVPGSLDVAVAPPFTALAAVAAALAPLGVAACAQDIYPQNAGPYTGAVSAPLVAEAGARYVLVGHSERRTLFGETFAGSAQRLQAALAVGLQPIVCVGEDAAARQAGRTYEAVTAQLHGALGEGSAAASAPLCLAYEPVWAIGTGHSATAAEVAQVHQSLRAALRARLGDAAAERCRILYGGSVTGANLNTFLAEPEVDGALVGGASLKADGFAQLIAQAAAGARHRSAGCSAADTQ